MIKLFLFSVPSHLFHWNILFLLGLALFGGTIGGRVFQKLKIPQVVGYLIIGIILGETGFNVINHDISQALQPFSYFALGLIGFMVGGELKKEMFKKYGKQFIYILLFEGISAFIAVSIIISIIAYFILHDFMLSLSVGILLGAIASATAPAATTDVLWEYKTKGPLTRTVLGIVAMDDGLALLLFAIASSVAGILMGNSDAGILTSLFDALIEIFGSIAIGLFLGYLLSKLIKSYYDEDKVLVFTLGIVLLNIGVSMAVNLDMLLSSMAMGTMIVNYSPRKSKNIFKLTSKFAPPVYVLFFVLIGAKLNIDNITFSIVILSLAYLIGRTSGKMLGAFFGAKLSNAPETVRKYLPLCLFSQAGVAIGLSILAGQKFPEDVGNLIVIVITASTFVVQIIGPYFVKIAVVKSEEAGLNITEEDLIKQTKVKEIMNKDIPRIPETMNLKHILRVFSENDSLYYPVVDSSGKLIGVVAIEAVKDVFLENELSNLLLAHDIMEPVEHTAHERDSVDEIKRRMDKYLIEYMPIVDENNKLIGFVNNKQIKHLISNKILELQKKVDSLG